MEEFTLLGLHELQIFTLPFTKQKQRYVENTVIHDEVSVAKQFVRFSWNFAIVLYTKLSSKREFRENQPSDTSATNFARVVSKGGRSCIFVRNDKAFSSNAVFQFGLEKKFGALCHKN